MRVFRGRYRRQIALIAAALLLTVSATVLLGRDVAQAGPGAAPSAVLGSGIGGTVQRVQVLSETTAATTSSAVWVNLASMVVVVPAEERAMFLMRFSGESSCAGGVGAQWCRLRMRIAGAEANPVVGGDFAFDSTDNGSESFASWESHAIERYSRIMGPGTYRVEVQWQVTDPAVRFRLDDWTFVVERVQIISP